MDLFYKFAAPEMEFKEFEPQFKSAKTQFKFGKTNPSKNFQNVF